MIDNNDIGARRVHHNPDAIKKASFANLRSTGAATIVLKPLESMFITYASSITAITKKVGSGLVRPVIPLPLDGDIHEPYLIIYGDITADTTVVITGTALAYFIVKGT